MVKPRSTARGQKGRVGKLDSSGQGGAFREKSRRDSHVFSHRTRDVIKNKGYYELFEEIIRLRPNSYHAEFKKVVVWLRTGREEYAFTPYVQSRKVTENKGEIKR